LVKKTNFIQSLFLLAAIVGVGFAVFTNREALAQTFTSRPTTQSELTPQQPTTSDRIESAPILTKSTSFRKSQIIVPTGGLVQQSTFAPEPAPQPTPLRRPTPRQIISPEQRESFDEINRTPQVLKPSFLSKQEIFNPKAFNKRKFGIDTDLTARALQKSASDRSLEERKNLAQERARGTFDSRRITNF